jgi:hypothetical protein
MVHPIRATASPLPRPLTRGRDILLLEVGFVAIAYADWLGRGLPARGLPGPGRGLSASGKEPVAWVLRWVLFKLMLMSGVVKVQANCPTWLNLTALVSITGK